MSITPNMHVTFRIVDGSCWQSAQSASAQPAEPDQPMFEIRDAAGQVLSKNRPVQWVEKSRYGYMWSRREAAESMANQIRTQGFACVVRPVEPIAAPAPASPICTCPSGDGSLRHPCPSHPSASPEGCNCHLGRGDHAFGCPAASAEGEWKRMFEDAARDMAAIDAALGIDPEEAGGAEPILAAIEELKATASPADQVEDARDAARYRWLVYHARIEARQFIHDGFDPSSTKQPLDNAIDAAMSASKEGA